MPEMSEEKPGISRKSRGRQNAGPSELFTSEFSGSAGATITQTDKRNIYRVTKK
jgi:hypothetical protein